MGTALARIAIVIPLALAAAPALAQVGDRTGATAIARGAYYEAEKTLLAELRIYPGRPELLLNLAAVYARTGRHADARALYQRVLGQEEVLMDLPAERIAGSHAVAQTGLRKLAPVQLSTR